VRQVFLSKSGEVLVDEAPAPALGAGEVLIDVAYSLISTGTETAALARGDLRSRIDSALRLARAGAERLHSAGLEETLRKARSRGEIASPSGYSVAGRVRDVGAEVSDLRPGDPVAAGGSAYAYHAEVVAVPRNLVARVPAELPLSDASFATVGAIALQGVRRAAPQVGETVVVIGLGLLGQLTVEILGASGCRVIGMDPRADRLDLAREGPQGLLAASASAAALEREVLAATRGAGADAVLLCAGTATSEPANLALRLVRQRGRVVVVGAVGMDLQRDPFYRKEVEFTISCSYGPGRYDPSYEEGGLDYPIGFVRWTENRNLLAFLDLCARRRVLPARLVAARFPLERASEAFAAAKAGAARGVAFLLEYGEPPAALERSVLRAPARASKSSGAIGVGLIGGGSFAASTLLPALAALNDFSLRAVASRTGASALRVAREFGAPVAASDPEVVLNDPAVDAVVIATRHDSHASLALAALAAGKHVFLEKPMALARAELDALRDAALASDRVFTVGYNRRYAPFSLAVRDALAASPGPRVVGYRVNAGAAPPGHWTVDPKLGGGRIVGEACHMLDLLCFWLGPDVVEWHATGVSAPGAEGRSPEDFSVTLRVRAASGLEHVASLVYTALGHREIGKERVEIHVAGGSLVIDDFASLAVHGLPLRPVRRRQADKGHRAELRAFRDAVRGEASPLLGVEEAWRAADLALRIDESLRARR
jgi:predicted dehydrogenase/threonine dehydrogenase-like Zn-dependent dehydrogenase